MSRQAGYSPREAHEPLMVISRVTAACSGNSICAGEVADERQLAALPQSSHRKLDRGCGADRFHGQVGPAPAGAVENFGLDVADIGEKTFVSPELPRHFQPMCVNVHAIDPSAAGRPQGLHHEQADHARADDDRRIADGYAGPCDGMQGDG